METIRSVEDAVAPLRLLAFDSEDLAVVSAHMQDAVVKVADIAFLPREKRFALAGCRFDWQHPEKPRRRLSGLHFDFVQGAAHHAMPQDKDAVLNLLAVTFEPGEAPGGQVVLLFSGETAIRLDVECLEGQMRDLGPCWDAAHCPEHDGKDTAVSDGVA